MAGAVSRAASWQGVGALPVLGAVMPHPANRSSLRQRAMLLSLLPYMCRMQQHDLVQHNAHACRMWTALPEGIVWVCSSLVGADELGAALAQLHTGCG